MSPAVMGRVLLRLVKQWREIAELEATRSKLQAKVAAESAAFVALMVKDAQAKRAAARLAVRRGRR